MTLTLTHPPSSLEKLNPATENPLPAVLMASLSEVNDAILKARTLVNEASKASQPDADTAARHRMARVLKTVCKRLLQRQDSFVGLLAQEVGKPPYEAIGGDLMPSAAWLQYCARRGPRLLAESVLDVPMAKLLGRSTRIRRAPFGVAAVITPWNYPLGITISGISTALMGGNAVVLKPSELTAGVGQAVSDLFRDALDHHGLSADWVQCLQGDGSVGALLTRHPDVDIALFTGSEATGRQVQAAMQARGKSVLLELGGNDAMLVLPDAAQDDAEMDILASTALWGRCVNAGQTCSAVKRLFVHASLSERLTRAIADKMGQLKVGGPDDAASQMGPLISRAALKKITEQVEEALKTGATALAGGYPLDGPGYFYPPTLLIDVPAEARVLQEEVFGPVLPVIVYEDVDTAIEQINATNLGLTASIFGPLEVAQEIARRITSGSVSLNGLPHMNYGLPQVPWIGWGRSGPGVSHGEAGLLALTQPQIITTETRAQKQSWFYATPSQMQDPALPLAMARLLGAGNIFATLWALPGVMLQGFKNLQTSRL